MIVLFVTCKEDVPAEVTSSMGICILLYHTNYNKPSTHFSLKSKVKFTHKMSANVTVPIVSIDVNPSVRFRCRRYCCCLW